MSTILVIVLGVVGIGVLINLLSDEKTKLFRRVWSSERLMHTNSHMATKQAEAISTLITKYNIVATDDKEELRKSVVGLLADAAIFDKKNPNNFGVEVAPVIARALRMRFPNIAD